jgi:hypothetical protein
MLVDLLQRLKSKVKRVRHIKIFNRMASEFILLSTAGYIGILVYESAWWARIILAVATFIVVVIQDEEAGGKP